MRGDVIFVIIFSAMLAATAFMLKLERDKNDALYQENATLRLKVNALTERGVVTNNVVLFSMPSNITLPYSTSDFLTNINVGGTPK